MSNFIRFIFNWFTHTRHMATAAFFLGTAIAIGIVLSIPAERAPNHQFTVTEFRDSYGRACTVVEGRSGTYGMRSVSIDCERWRTNFQ